MISAHVAGVQHTYKKMKKEALAKCLVCGEYSECQISKHEVSIHIFYIKIKSLGKEYLFDWRQCSHRAVLYDKQDVSRYHRDYEETGILSVPYYPDMKLRTKVLSPKASPAMAILAVISALLVGALLALLLHILGVPYVP